MRPWFLLLTVLFLGCSPKPLVQVVSRPITEKDISRKVQVLREYYPQYDGDIRAGALGQLVEAYRLAEILGNHGRPVTESILEQEAKRIDESSLMPEALDRIKAIFGKDHRSYLHVYVLPVYVQRVIYYEFFLQDRKIQAESLAKARAFLNHAKQSVKAAKEAFTEHSSIQKFSVSLEDGLQLKTDGNRKRDHRPPPSGISDMQAKLEEDQRQRVSLEGKRWVKEVISGLKPGEVYPQVVDQQETWWVVRYLGQKAGQKDSYELEAAVFPKADYDQWLSSEQAKVPVKYFN